MVKYAKIENGNIVEVANKPTSKTTSNLWLNNVKLKEEGWLPVDDKKPTNLKPWEELGTLSTEVLTTKVNYNYQIKTLSVEEFKTVKKNDLINNFSLKIGEKYPKQIQLLALFGALDAATTKEVQDYYKLKGKELEDALKAVDSALNYQEINTVQYIQ